MNRRTLKKHCARAATILVDRHGYRMDQFEKATGQESIDAPHGMERRFVRNGWLEPGLLKGTLLLWECDYFGEGDYILPLDLLREIEFWENVSIEECKRMLEL